MIRFAPMALLVLLAACEENPGSPASSARAASPAPQGEPAHGSEAPADRAAGRDGTRVPERFQGMWARSNDACATPAHESKLTLDAGRIGFHESEGPVLRTIEHDDTLTVVSLLSGEGESREATHRFRLAPDGATLTAIEGGLVRVRCPP